MLAVALPQPIPQPRPLPLAAFTPRICRPATNVEDQKPFLGGWKATITPELLQQYVRKTIASVSPARSTTQALSVSVNEEAYHTFREQLFDPSVPESDVTSEVRKDWVKSRLEQGKKVCDSCFSDPGQCRLPDEHPGLDCSACIGKSTHSSWRRDFVVWASAREFGVSVEEAAVLYDKYDHEDSRSAATITDAAVAPAKVELKGDIPPRATSVQAATNVDVEVDVYAYTDADAEGEPDEDVQGVAEPGPVGETEGDDEIQLLAKEADVEVFVIPDDSELTSALDVDTKTISQFSCSPNLPKRVTRPNTTILATPTSTSKTTRRRAPESISISQPSAVQKIMTVSAPAPAPAPAPASPSSQKRPRPDHDDLEQHHRPKRIPKPSEKIRAMSSVSTSSSLFGHSLSISAPAGAKGKGKAPAKSRVKVEDEINNADDSVSAGLVTGKGLKRGRGRPPGVSGGKKVADRGEGDEELGDGEVVVVRAKRPRLSGPSSLALPSPAEAAPSRTKIQNGPITAFAPGDDGNNDGGVCGGEGVGSLPTPTSSAPSPPSVHPTPSAATSAAPTARDVAGAPSTSAPAAPQEPPRRPRGRPRKNPLPPPQASSSASATPSAPFVPSPLVEGALALQITQKIDVQTLKEHFISLRDGYNQLHAHLSLSPPSPQPQVQSDTISGDTTSASISSEPDNIQTLRTELDQTKSSLTNTLAQLAKSQSELAKARKKANKDNASSRQELEQSRRELGSLKGQLEQAKGELEQARRREEWWAWERGEMQRRLGGFPAAVGGAGLSYGATTANASGGWGTQDWFWTSQAQNQTHGQPQTHNGSQNTYGSSYASSNFAAPSSTTGLTFGASISPTYVSTSSSTTSSSQTASQPHAQPQSPPHAAPSSSLTLSPQGPAATSLSPYHYGPVAWGYVQPNFDAGLGKGKEAGSGGKVQGGKQGKKQTKKKHLSFVNSEAGGMGALGGASGSAGAAASVPATVSSSSNLSTATLSQAQASPQATPGTTFHGASESRSQLQGPGQPPSSARPQVPSIAHPQSQPQIYAQPRSRPANEADDSNSLSRLESQLQALAQARVQAGARVQPQGSIHLQVQPQTQHQSQISSEKQTQSQPHSLTQPQKRVEDKSHPLSYVQTPTQVQSELQIETRTQAKEQPHAPTPTYPEAFFSPFPLWPPLDVDMSASASASAPAPSSSQSTQSAQPSPAAGNTTAKPAISGSDKLASTLASAMGTTIDPRTLAVSSSTLSSAFMKNLDPSLQPPMSTATSAGLATLGGGSTTASAPAPASGLSSTPTAANSTTPAAAAARPGLLTSQQQMKASFGWMGGSYSHS